MSLLDKAAAALTAESEGARREARTKARAAAGVDDWLELLLEQHERIEEAFATVRAAQAGPRRLAALRSLSLLLTGHSNAEESVIYPALVRAGHKSHAMAGYTEEAEAKADMGQLEYLDPASQEFLDKLEQIREAVLHHMYEEERDRLLDLKALPAAEQDRLTERFKEEFERYMGDDAPTGARLYTKSEARIPQ